MRWVLPFENSTLTGYTLAWLGGATTPHEQIGNLLGHGCHGRNVSREAVREEMYNHKRVFSDASKRAQSYNVAGMGNEPCCP